MATSTIARAYLRCADCLSFAVIERQTGVPVPPTACGLCGGQMRWAGSVRHDPKATTHEPACDGRCINGRGPVCRCTCGGQFHGSGLVVPVRFEAGASTVEPRVDTRGAAERAAEYRAAVEACWEGIERIGWLGVGPTIREQHMAHQGISYRRPVWQYIRRLEDVADVPSHGKRMRLLRELLDELQAEARQDPSSGRGFAA